MQAFLWLFWESFVSPCAMIPPHRREGNSVMLLFIPVSSLHRFSVINAFISFSFLQVLRFDCPITKKHATIELSPDLNLILSNLCLLIFKTTGRATDEPELKLNWEQHYFTQVFVSSAPSTERGTMVLKQHQPGIPGNESKCIYAYIYIYIYIYMTHIYTSIYFISYIYM